eukprot:COSAG02_NODE_1123_length_14441_cov_28.984521_14_plen_171_part_00
MSGDRHIGGVYKMEDGHRSTTNGVVDGPYSVPYTIWDITSSALTHTYPGHESATCVMATNGTFAEASCDEAGPNRVGPLVHLNNIGIIDVDWEAPNGGNVVISLVKAERTPKQGFHNDAVRSQHDPYLLFLYMFYSCVRLHLLPEIAGLIIALYTRRARCCRPYLCSLES